MGARSGVNDSGPQKNFFTPDVRVAGTRFIAREGEDDVIRKRGCVMRGSVMRGCVMRGHDDKGL